MPSIYDDPDYKQIVAFFRSRHEETPSFTRFLDFTIDSPNHDTPVLTFNMRDNLVGNLIYRTLHGGVIASMLDVVGGHCVWLQALKQIKGQPLEKQVKRISRIGSIDLRVDYLQPGKGASFEATAVTLRMGNKVAVVRSELRNEKGDLIAVGTGTYTTG